jgi:hypothetical protein
MAERNPFEILGISEKAEGEVIAAAYRALAKKYHPDTNSGVPAAELTRRMVDLNWAKDELDRDLPGWRLRTRRQPTPDPSPRKQPPREAKESAGATYTEQDETQPARSVTIEVHPQLIHLSGIKGASATFTASMDIGQGASIKARVAASSPLGLERVAPTQADFRVFMPNDFAEGTDNLIEIVEVYAGDASANVFVSISPATAAAFSQAKPAVSSVASPRHASPDMRLPWGQHQSRTLREIALEHPSYLNWVIDSADGASPILKESARMALEEAGQPRLGPRPKRSKSKKKRKALPKADPNKWQPVVPPGTYSRSSDRHASTAAPMALPDPARPGGLLDAVKGLFGRKPKR